jgi:hypothetical protein
VPRRRSTRVRMGLGLLSKRVVSTGSDRVRMPPDGCRGPAALANNAGNLRDGPHLAVELVPTLPGSTNFVGCAIHSSHDRSPADTHGQFHGRHHLRRSSSGQVATLPDLALQAGSRHRRRKLPPQYPLAVIGKVGGAYGLDDFVSGNVELFESSRHVLIEFGSRKGIGSCLRHADYGLVPSQSPSWQRCKPHRSGFAIRTLLVPLQSNLLQAAQ